MAFAMFYNGQDAPLIEAALNSGTLNASDRRIAQAIWNGGFSTWRTAPIIASTDPSAAGDPDVHRIVITATVQGQTVTVQMTRDLLYRVCNNNLGIPFCCAVADDMRTTAIEPYPPV